MYVCCKYHVIGTNEEEMTICEMPPSSLNEPSTSTWNKAFQYIIQKFHTLRVKEET